MGNLRSWLSGVAIASLAACSGGGEAKPDSTIIVVPDAAIDAPMVDAAPVYDFSCEGGSLPTTAPAKITLGGTTLTAMGGTVGSVAVQILKRGTMAPMFSMESDANGVWGPKDVTTGGIPFDGYIHSFVADYRSTYEFPPEKIAANIPSFPVLMTSVALFNQLNQIGNQNDTTNGVILINVTDCANALVGGAAVSAKQGGTDVGTIYDLGSLIDHQLDGLYLVFNVPDGPTDVGATYLTHAFVEHKVIAVKKSADATPDANGTITSTIVRPGPL